MSTTISRDLLTQAVDLARSAILDRAELEYGGTPQWPRFRNWCLKVFGDRGLQGHIDLAFGERKEVGDGGKEG